MINKVSPLDNINTTRQSSHFWHPDPKQETIPDRTPLGNKRRKRGIKHVNQTKHEDTQRTSDQYTSHHWRNNLSFAQNSFYQKLIACWNTAEYSMLYNVHYDIIIIPSFSGPIAVYHDYYNSRRCEYWADRSNSTLALLTVSCDPVSQHGTSNICPHYTVSNV